MGIIDSFRKKKEASQEEEHTTPPPKGHALAEILNDKTNSHLFGTLLDNDGQESLGKRVATGNLEEDDIELLEEYRKKYSEKVIESETIEKLLTEENVIEIARSQPDFAKIINILGPQKAIRAIRSQLREMCFTDGERFSRIAEPIVEYDSYKNGEYKKTNDKVEKFCKDNNISIKGYLEALDIEDPKEKEEALKKLAGEKQEGWKVWNAITLKTARNLKGLQSAEAEMELSIAELDKYKEAVGDMLYTSVSGNKDMRDAFARELLSESAPAVEPKSGFEGGKKEALGAFDENQFNKDWTEYKKKMNYDGSDDDEKDNLKDLFIDDQKKAYRTKNKGHEGFWTSIFGALFEGKIDDKKDTLK